MHVRSFISIFALVLVAAFAVSAQQNSPVGRWKTFDEDTGKQSLIVEVYEEKDGTYSAKIVETLFAPKAVCNQCNGGSKGKPLIGMIVMWGLRSKGDGTFGGGSLLKPANGKVSKTKLVALDGDKLNISGCIGIICKQGAWIRVN